MRTFPQPTQRPTPFSQSFPESLRTPSAALELPLTLDPVVEPVPEPLDLGRDHRQVRQLRLALRVPRHARDHLREQVEKRLLEGHQMPVGPHPPARFLERLRLGILPADRSLKVSALPCRPGSLLSLG